MLANNSYSKKIVFVQNKYLHINIQKQFIFWLLFLLISTNAFSNGKKKKKPVLKNTSYTTKNDSVFRKVIPFDLETSTTTHSSSIDDLIWFAKQQIGTPYKYACADPHNGGLDCSGFLYYVFQHYKIKVPRSSKDYMNFGKPITKSDAQKGDVIIFTGSNASKRVGGHVGIILENKNDEISFIHSSSGKSNGVIISKLSDGYYSQRFLKIVRIVN